MSTLHRPALVLFISVYNLTSFTSHCPSTHAKVSEGLSLHQVFNLVCIFIVVVVVVVMNKFHV
jgi:hypothetical protein